MADSGALRMKRSRAHAQGDHSLCRDPQACLVDEHAETELLVEAVKAEWADEDPLSRAMALRLARLAGGRGPAAVSALRGLAEMTAFQRGPGGMVWPAERDGR